MKTTTASHMVKWQYCTMHSKSAMISNNTCSVSKNILFTRLACNGHKFEDFYVQEIICFAFVEIFVSDRLDEWMDG